MKPEEIRKLEAYFKRTFNNPTLQVRARPQKQDSAELYLGEEFLAWASSSATRRTVTCPTTSRWRSSTSTSTEDCSASAGATEVPAGGIHGDSRRIRDVERPYRPVQIEPRQPIHRFPRLLPETLAFRAQHQRDLVA